ncbi:hypothetical protein PUMCH_000269 [Australozyma saopauloensis]|uniref:BRO domain-containing protein 1 n=1 Tax=Australozyma saopauloensis TaxID=291208 RepID=A0AAX4H3C3_9ASCO|nr:hypothetical protein PUMCH_000269 [[Candida] saopauloensis]
MKASLLTVPTKKTEEVNWSKPLTKYLLSVYGNTSEFLEDVKSFNKLRLDIRGAHADDTGIGLYMRYYSYLELVDLRVPMDVVNKHKSMKFIWHDAFVPSSLHEQFALAFEKASVLFNIGSLMTKAASVNYNISKRSTGGDEQAFKKAIRLYQEAAGVFEFLSKTFLNGPSNDLNPSTISFLINLCLAQVQEVFTLKAIDGDLEQKMNSVIAKLCTSTAQCFDECYKVISHLSTAEGASKVSNHSTYAVTESDVESLSGDEQLDFEYDPDKNGLPDEKVSAQLDPFWVSIIEVKALYYKSLACYFQGLQLESKNKYGEAISYLSKSSDLLAAIPTATLKSVAKSGGEDAFELLDNYKYQRDAVDIKLKDITKDNDLIYHDIIPNVATIVDPKPMKCGSAKPILISENESFSQVHEHSYTNFLSNVVPINVHELLSFYSEEKSQLLRAEIDENDVAAEKLASALECLKLPKALVTIKELLNTDQAHRASDSVHVSLPPDVISKVNEISASYERDIGNRKEIHKRREHIYNLINNSQKNIEKIQFSDSSAKFRDDLIRLKKSLYDAGNSDSRLFEPVDGENSQLFQTLGHGIQSSQFQTLFAIQANKVNPSFDINNEISLLDVDDSQLQEQSSSISGQITAIEDILNDLNVLKRERQNLLSSLKEDIHKDDISNVIMLNSKTKSTKEIKTEFFPEELKKFEVYLKKLDYLIKKQESVITELQNKWLKLETNPKVKEIQSLSTFQNTVLAEQVSRINQFNSSWRGYSAGLQQALEFYGQLLRFAEGLNRAIENEINNNQVSNSFSSLQLGSPAGSFGQFQRPEPHATQNQGLPPKPPRVNSNYSGEIRTEFQPEHQPSNRANRPQVEPQFSGFNSPSRPNQAGGPMNPPGQTLIYDEPSAYQPNMYNFFLKGN